MTAEATESSSNIMEKFMEASITDKMLVIMKVMVLVPQKLIEKLSEGSVWDRCQHLIGCFIFFFAAVTALITIARGSVNVIVGLWQILVLLKRNGPGTWVIHAFIGIVLSAFVWLPIDVLKNVLDKLIQLIPRPLLTTFMTERSLRRYVIQ